MSLNSNVGAQPDSPQYRWLEQDLAGTTARCTLAFWHHPVFNSGLYGSSTQMKEVWRLLQKAGAEIVINGHEHLYESFSPQDADGRADPNGIREFIVGTGGAHLTQTRTIQPNSVVRDSQTFGVLKLTLRGGDYDWEFVPVQGQSFRDSGTGTCH